MLNVDPRPTDPSIRRVAFLCVAAAVVIGLIVGFVLLSADVSFLIALLTVVVTVYAGTWLLLFAGRYWLRRRREI
jgi:uncharacterized membrane protein